jgi:hypothetical protein
MKILNSRTPNPSGVIKIYNYPASNRPAPKLVEPNTSINNFQGGVGHLKTFSLLHKFSLLTKLN